jgi:Tol biopolymer transport system component
MSPEQARGQELDARTDLFSFGVVLYEMATGRRPFAGKTSAVIFEATLNQTPIPPRELNPGLPAELGRIIDKALEKDREVRYQTAAELRADLKRLKRNLDSGRTAAAGTSPRTVMSSRGRWLAGLFVWTAAFVALAILIGGPIWFHFYRPGDQPPQRSPKEPEEEPALPPLQITPFTSFPGRAISPRFSPNGDRIAFVWDGEDGENFDIYVKTVGAGVPLRLTSDRGDDVAPAWSPNGTQIAFCRVDWASNEYGIWVTSALGPPEQRLISLREPVDSLDWSPDGKWLAFGYTEGPEKPWGVYLLSVQDGSLRRVMNPPKGSMDDTPVFSPDGTMLAFTRGTLGLGGKSIYRVRVADGHPRGEPEPITFAEHRPAGLSWTEDGREIVFSEAASGERAQIWRIPVTGGKAQPVAGVGDNAVSPAVSRHGHRLAYTKALDEWNIWRLRIGKPGERPVPERFIYSTQGEDAPNYSPDGKHIVFASNRWGSYEIWKCSSDGRNPTVLTSLGGPCNGSPCWSPDGRHIAFDSQVQGTFGIYVVDKDGGPAVRVTDKDDGDAVNPGWSKDGKWIYFTSTRTGACQIWKIPPVAGRKAVQVTHEGAWRPCVSADGKSVYYYHNETYPSIRQIPIEGGKEEEVLPLPKDTWGEHWTLGERGIYFIDWAGQTHVQVLAAQTVTSLTTLSLASATTQVLTVKRFQDAFALIDWGATPRAAIKRFSFETREITRLGDISKERRNGQFFGPGKRLGVSPDEQWLLYVQYEQSGSDIMLVENFR